jgi:hypothetical protein
VEYRSWATDYRGWLVIHAAKTVAKPCPDPVGVVLGLVELVDIVEGHRGYHWKLKRPHGCPPFLFKGNTGLRAVPHDLRDHLRLYLGHLL